MMTMTNKLWEFIDRLYSGLMRARGYEDSVRLVCELFSEYAEAAALVFVSGVGPDIVAFSCSPLDSCGEHLRDEKFVWDLAQTVSAIPQININIPVAGLPKGGADVAGDVVAIVVPIIANAERLGTLTALRRREFLPEELIIGEAAGVVLAANMAAMKNERYAAAIKDAAAVRAALGTLSYSELAAAVEVFRRLVGDEGIIIAAKVASDSKATRSAIVNALRKLESAGLLESHSMGVKGTYIKIMTPALREELRKFDK